MSDLIRDAVNAIGGLLTSQHNDLIRLLRTPTPMKVTLNVTADGTGTFGGGFSNPNPILLYQCPMSQEAHIHRLTVQSPGGTPKTPLTTGQVALVGSSGELIFFLPIGGTIAPLIMAEGYASAAHLNAGSKIGVYGDGLPANTSLRFDLQISFTAGVSQYTPLGRDESKVQILE